jgi:hypothetical protein
MAKKKQTLLENVFDAASVIEEAIVGTAGTRSRPYPNHPLGPLMAELGDRWDAIKMAKKFGGTREAFNEFKNIAKDDLSNAGYAIKKGAKAAGGHIKAHKTAYGSGLLGLGAAGAGAYALRDKLGDAANDAGEAMHSLRDKLAGLFASHQEA